MDRLIAIPGLAILLGVAWALSTDRRRFPWRAAAWGLGLQLVLAVLLLRTPFGLAVFDGARAAITRVLGFADVGAAFMWGNLYRGSDELVQFLEPAQGHIQVTDSLTGGLVPLGTVFVIHILPVIIFFSSLMAVLYHLGIMQLLIRGLAWVMSRTMGTSGSESLAAAANVFVGMTEAPLAIRPYLPTMTRSELMALMVSGFATIAGSVMAVYIRFGINAGHVVAASVMSAPAALVIAKIMLPETEESPTRGTVTLHVEKEYANVLDAAAGGAGVGLRLAANVGAMLLAFVALVAMVNWLLGFAGLSLEQIFGWVFAPLAFVMGVPWSEAAAFGNLLGTKIAVNELVGYLELVQAQQDGTLSPRSIVIGTYALCGFANFGSIAIQLGGIGTLAPGRRGDAAKLGLKAMLGGALASWTTAAIAGMLVVS